MEKDVNGKRAKETSRILMGGTARHWIFRFLRPRKGRKGEDEERRKRWSETPKKKRKEGKKKGGIHPSLRRMREEAATQESEIVVRNLVNAFEA